MHETDHYVALANGSEIWVDGLDDKDRVEKILGREYATVFFNEVSQIPYPSVETVLTRLAQKIEGCRTLAVYDENPATRRHWSYKQFVQKIDPDTDAPLAYPGRYKSLAINPEDNRDNLPNEFFDTLDALSGPRRKRFRDGLFQDFQGAVFRNWDVVEAIPEEIISRGRTSYGLDFGFSVDPSVVVFIVEYDRELWIDQLLYETQLTNQQLAALMFPMVSQSVVWADSAEPKSIAELRAAGLIVTPAAKGPDSVRSGLDWLLSYSAIHVTARSVDLQNELDQYAWKADRDGRPLPEPVDAFNHGIDAIRYAGEPLRPSRAVARIRRL